MPTFLPPNKACSVVSSIPVYGPAHVACIASMRPIRLVVFLSWFRLLENNVAHGVILRACAWSSGGTGGKGLASAGAVAATAAADGAAAVAAAGVIWAAGEPDGAAAAGGSAGVREVSAATRAASARAAFSFTAADVWFCVIVA